jgi:integrase
MPKITKVQRQGGVRYRFTLSLGVNPRTGKRTQRVYQFDSPQQAEAERARLTGQLADGTYASDTDARKMTVNAAIDAYLASACFGLAESTKVSYAGCLKPVIERLGRRTLASLRRADIEELRDFMLATGRRRGGQPGTGLGPRSVRLTIGRLAAALEQQVTDGVLARNPAAGVKLPAQGKREGTTWSEAELRAFSKTAATDRLHAAWALVLLGMRRGEVLGLRWDDWDRDAGTVTIGRARTLVYGRVVTKEPKSERGYRTLPLPGEQTAAALAARHRAEAAERLQAGPAWEASGYVAVDELGRPLHPDWFTDEFHRICAAAGVPRIRLHDARHTTSSLLAAAGVPDHIRAAWCGHTTAVQVSTYTHARPEDLAVASKALAGILSGA